MRSLLRSSLLVAFFAAALPATAQFTVGRVQGTVSDSTGAVVDSARVTLRHTATNAVRTYTTSHDGLFAFLALPPGSYTVTAEHPGFTATSTRVTVVTSETATCNLVLAVSRSATTVEVRSEPFNVSEAQHSTTRVAGELTDLPEMGHNMMSFVHLAPGVTPTNNPRGGSTFGGGGSYVIILGVQSGLISANGGRARAASVQLDYTDANDWEGGGFAPGTQAITPDMLQEFKVLTNNVSAEYGFKSNAHVMMVTKSGTNNLHGTAYDFLQNDAFNARDYFDRSGRPSPNKQNVYGITGGGPLVRDRTFFFAGYEGRKTRGASLTTVASVPTASARARAQDPIIVDLMTRFLPTPTKTTANPDVGTVASQIPSPVDNYQFIAKVDHRFSVRHTISARYLQGIASFVARFPSQNLLPGFDVDNHFEMMNTNVTDSLVLNPKTVNELRLAYAHDRAMGRPQNGIQTPRFNITGMIGFGALNSVPAGRDFNVFQLNDVFSHIAGQHLWKTGFDGRYIQDNSLNATNSRGVFTFSSLDKFLAAQPSSWTQLFGNTQRAFRTALYAFFVHDDWKIRPTLTLNLGLRWEIQSALREAHGLNSVLDPELQGDVGTAGAGPLGAFHLGATAVDRNAGNVAPRVGFAWNPRGTNLVVRGGYGIYWDSFTFGPLNAARSAPPLNYTFVLSGSQISGANSFANLMQGTAPVLAQAQAQVGSFGTLRNFGAITTIDPHLSNPYVQDYSLGTEYRLPGGYVVGLSYVGTKGTRLTRLIPINPVARGPRPASSVADEAARLAEFTAAVAAENGAGNTRLDPRFDQVSLHDDGGSSTYNSLQATFRKTFQRGFQLQAAYTWSKSIDDASDFAPTIQANDNSYAQNGSDLRSERAVSNFDMTHRFVLTGIWEVPSFHNAEGWRRQVLQGWSFQFVNQWQSGLPATLLAGSRYGISDLNLDGNLIPTGSDNTRADCVAGGSSFRFGDPSTIPPANQRGVNGAPNSANFGFTQPLLGHNGTCGRNTLRMRALLNFDWAAVKQWQLSERGPLGSGPWNLQGRLEIFNVFNTPFLTAQGDGWRTLSSPVFGQYNAAGATRRLQIALRLVW